MVRTAPVIAVLFGIPALSLAGIPPFSGFIAKFAVLDATAQSGQWVVMGAAVLTGLLTLFSMSKIWIGVFWAPREDESVAVDAPDRARSRLGGPLLMVGPTALLVALSIAIGIWAGPLLDLATRAADDLSQPTAYVEAVLGERDAPTAAPEGGG
jgi:multicomponent Na+:H+ antiporter subunit D